MIRIGVVADSHFDELSRFEECCAVHSAIASDAGRLELDLLLHAGDVYERKSTPKERYAVAQWVQQVTRYCPLVIVRGNHDALGDLTLLAKLETDHPVYVVEDARVIEVAGVVIGCLAWPSKASVLAMGASSHAEGELLASEALQNVLRGLGDQMENLAGDDLPRVLLAHAMVRGSVTSVGQPLVGCDLELGIDDIGLAKADLYALGHIHKGQSWTVNGAPVVYPGSPRRTAFGEVEVKGYTVATFDEHRLVGVELIETPCAPMFLVEDEWGYDDESQKFGWLVGMHGDPSDEEAKGAEVRVRYLVAADQREQARAAAERYEARLIERGAVNVKLDPRVIPVNMARAPEVARAVTVADKLGAYWTARGTVPEAPRATRLLSLVQELEAQNAL